MTKNGDLESKQDDMAGRLLEIVCWEVHRVMKRQPGVFEGSDGYDDLIRLLAEKLHEYANLSGEGYQGPAPTDDQFIIVHGVPRPDVPEDSGFIGPFYTEAIAKVRLDREVSPEDAQSWWIAPMRLP